MKLRIVVVSLFFSEGMGYTENCLPRALARRGHDVHIVTSTYNVYGNEKELYESTYSAFLGPAKVESGTAVIDGVTVHRLPSRLFAGYVYMDGLLQAVRRIDPDIVHALEIASLQNMQLAAASLFSRYRLFAETHQTKTVVKAYLKSPHGHWLKRFGYWLTRTLPVFVASLPVRKCYAVTPDCGEVARRYYGVPASKIVYYPLGVDTETFRPAQTPEELAGRVALRRELGIADDDVLCLYTGRFTEAKNPLLLARAIEHLSVKDPRFRAVFIGDGVQRDEIASHNQCIVLPFVKHERLAEIYRAADLCVWPRQETISMIDAAASGVPLVISDQVGERQRVEGNGEIYRENDLASLEETLLKLADPVLRAHYGEVGRAKMQAGFSWSHFAGVLERDFSAALGRGASPGSAA